MKEERASVGERQDTANLLFNFSKGGPWTDIDHLARDEIIQQLQQPHVLW